MGQPTGGPTPTTGSKVGIVYSTGRMKLICGHVYVDSDGEWPAWEAAMAERPEFGFFYVDMAHHHAGHDVFYQAINDAMLARHGVNAVQHGDPSANCAVIDPATGVVESVIRADDSIHSFPGRILKNHPGVQVGHVYNSITGKFKVPAYTLAAKPGVRATPVAVPEAEI